MVNTKWFRSLHGYLKTSNKRGNKVCHAVKYPSNESNREIIKQQLKPEHLTTDIIAEVSNEVLLTASWHLSYRNPKHS